MSGWRSLTTTTLLCLVATTVYTDPWDDDDQLRIAIESAAAISGEELSTLDTRSLLETYMYRFVEHFPPSASTDEVLLLIEGREDLSTDDMLFLLSRIKLVSQSESMCRWNAGFWAIAALYGVASGEGLLNASQGSRANELMLGFVTRVVEFTVRSDGAYNW